MARRPGGGSFAAHAHTCKTSYSYLSSGESHNTFLVSEALHPTLNLRLPVLRLILLYKRCDGHRQNIIDSIFVCGVQRPRIQDPGKMA